MAKEKAEVSTTVANILGDALVPGMFNLVGCVVSFIAYQYFCFTNFCRVTKNKQGEDTLIRSINANDSCNQISAPILLTMGEVTC